MTKPATLRGKEFLQKCADFQQYKRNVLFGKMTIPALLLASVFMLTTEVIWAACPEGSDYDGSVGACVYPYSDDVYVGEWILGPVKSYEVTKTADFTVQGDTLILVGNRTIATSSDITVIDGVLQLGLDEDNELNQGGVLQSVTLQNSTLNVYPVLYEPVKIVDGVMQLTDDATGFYIHGFIGDSSSVINIAKGSNLVLSVNEDGTHEVFDTAINNYGNLYLIGANTALIGGQLDIQNSFINYEGGVVEIRHNLTISAAASDQEVFINNGVIKANVNIVSNRDIYIGKTGIFSSNYANQSYPNGAYGLHIAQSELINEGKVYLSELFVEPGGSVNVKSGGLLYVERLETTQDSAVNLEDGSIFVAETLESGNKVVRTGEGSAATLYLGYFARKLYSETADLSCDEGLHIQLGSPRMEYVSYVDSRLTWDCNTCQAPDPDKSEEFGLTTPGGKVGALDVYSGAYLITPNPTWVIGADTTVLNGGIVQTYDAGYLMSSNKLSIEDGGRFEVLTYANEDSGCIELGSLVINGEVVNKGTFDSSNGYEVYIGSTGSFTSSGSHSKAEFSQLIIDGGSMVIEDGASMTVQELGSEGASSLGKLAVTGQNTTVSVTTPSITNYDVTVTPGAFLGLGVTKEVADAVGYITNNKAVLALKSDLALEVGNSIVKVGTVPENVNLGTGDLYFAKDSVFIIDLPTVSTDSTRVPVILEGDPNKDGSIYVEKGSQLVVNSYSYGRTQLTAHLSSKLEDGAWEGDDLIYEKGESTNIALVKESGNLYLDVSGTSATYFAGTGDGTFGSEDSGEDSSNGSGSSGKTNEGHDTSIQGLSKNFGLPEVINGLIDTNEGAAIRVTNADKADIQLINRLLSPTYFGNDQGEIDVQWSSKVWNSVSNIGAVSGVNAYSLDMNRQIVEAIEGHAGSDTEKALDRNLWVQVLGNTAQADSLKAQLTSKIGYKSKSYGFIFGADVLNSYDASIGIAFNYVKGDLDSKGNYVKTDSDAKIWGLNVYGSKQFGPAKISAIFSYQSSDGKATQSFTDLPGNGYAVRSDLDSKSIVFGVRGEYGFDLGKAVVKPHAGLRYSYTNFDDSSVNINGEKAFNVSTKNKGIVSMPIGVAVEGKLQADDWRLKPTFDLSLVPQFGSKSTSATVSAQNYNGVDSVSYNVTGNFMGELALGMEAQNKAHSFSIFYKGALGDQGRSSHSLNVGYRFSF